MGEKFLMMGLLKLEEWRMMGFVRMRLVLNLDDGV